MFNEEDVFEKKKTDEKLVKKNGRRIWLKKWLKRLVKKAARKLGKNWSKNRCIKKNIKHLQMNEVVLRLFFDFYYNWT